MLALAMAAAVAGCRAHTQELALDQAAQDFFNQNRLCDKPTKPTQGTQGASEVQSSGDAPPQVSETRAKLTPWIVGPNEYVIEGCQYQARYACDSEKCRRKGRIVSQQAFVEIAAPPPKAEAAGAGGEAAPPAVETGAETDAVREALDARRGEIAACVDRLPIGLRVELKVGAPPAVSLRGDLKGKPEEACVRSALKDLKAPAVQAPLTVIHIVK